MRQNKCSKTTIHDHEQTRTGACLNLLRCLTQYNSTWQIIQQVMVLDREIMPQIEEVQDNDTVTEAVLLLWHRQQRVVGHMAAQHMQQHGVEVHHLRREGEEERELVVQNVQPRQIIGRELGHSKCLRICMDEERVVWHYV